MLPVQLLALASPNAGGGEAPSPLVSFLPLILIFVIFWFLIIIGIVTVVIVLGWLLAYYSERRQVSVNKETGRLWLNFYALISREFYIIDIYAWLSRSLLSIATRLNVLLRWV